MGETSIRRGPASIRTAFTLVELLVVVGIIALLVAVLLPALARVRAAGRTTACLETVRDLQLAQLLYAADNSGRLVRVGLDHGSAHVREVAWVNTLQKYHGDELSPRCPSDQSVHWRGDDGTGGVPVPGSDPTDPKYRRTSYGLNDYLDVHSAAFEPAWGRLSGIPRPAATVQFLEMVESGEFAGGDHPHVDTWHFHLDPDVAPQRAAGQLQTNRHGGDRGSWEARANYGFLDGSARTLAFREVYRAPADNQFNPNVAQ